MEKHFFKLYGKSRQHPDFHSHPPCYITYTSMFVVCTEDPTRCWPGAKAAHRRSAMKTATIMLQKQMMPRCRKSHSEIQTLKYPAWKMAKYLILENNTATTFNLGRGGSHTATLTSSIKQRLVPFVKSKSGCVYLSVLCKPAYAMI